MTRLRGPLDIIAREQARATRPRSAPRRERASADPHGLVSALDHAVRLRENRPVRGRETAAHTYEVDLMPPPGAHLERVMVVGAGGREVAIQYDPDTRTAYPLRADSC